MAENEIKIALYSFKEDESCCADVIFGDDDLVTGFTIECDTQGMVNVKMPSDIDEFYDSERLKNSNVLEMVAEAYCEHAQSPIFVDIRDFDENDVCQADVILRSENKRYEGFVAKPGPGNGVIVHVPADMHQSWPHADEITWEDVRKCVIAEYRNITANRLFLRNAVERAVEEKVLVEQKANHQFKFYNVYKKSEVLANATINSTGETIEGIYVSVKQDEKDGEIFVSMPVAMKGKWNVDGIIWEEMAAIVKNEFRRCILNDTDVPASYKVKVDFGEFKDVTVCMVDIKLEHKKNTIHGFKVKYYENTGFIHAISPEWMTSWQDKKISWQTLSQLIIKEYKKQKDQIESQNS